MCCLVPTLGFCCSKQEFLNPSGMQNQMEKKKNLTHILYHDLYIAMKEKDRAPHNPQFPQPQNIRTYLNVTHRLPRLESRKMIK